MSIVLVGNGMIYGKKQSKNQCYGYDAIFESFQRSDIFQYSVGSCFQSFVGGRTIRDEKVD
ncbi:MAG: hypothetical protein US10_C0012G0017 [Candidatus Moranbacteria bacterium GW2011_GWD2_36_198]|nr:MAG: hypothetical protein US10_C0012G0017 [Candidatus Moranbacteria bacterium GW2011_GWD2_36_198]